MKLSEISPVLFRADLFKYSPSISLRPRISLEKSQYVYRFIGVGSGRLDFLLEGERFSISASDVVYLTPGEVYRILPTGSEFSLYNIFFGLTGQPSSLTEDHKRCVFLDGFDPSLCLSAIGLEETDALTRGRLIRGGLPKGMIERLYGLDVSDGRYPFVAEAALRSLITYMLSEVHSGEKESGADKIIRYIKANPDGDLSSAALSRLFSYHPNHINRILKKQTGKSLGELVRKAKIDYAKALLFEGAYSLSEIPPMLGYYDYSHFYKAFVGEVGISPTKYATLLRSQGE